jgi:hypothetical protein
VIVLALRRRPSATAALTLVLASGLVRAQTHNFENLAGSPAGTVLTGQSGWYIPPIGGGDGFVFTYAGHAWGVPANPQGGLQCESGQTSSTNQIRSQHTIDFSAAGVWLVTFDVLGAFNGTLPAIDNLGSFSIQPTSSRYTQTLMTWGGPGSLMAGMPDHTALADRYHMGVLWYTAAGSGAQFTCPGPEWRNLFVNHWYRCSIKWSFSSPCRIFTCTIQDLTVGGPVTTVYTSNFGWYLQGGASPSFPLPTDFRLFAGGNQGNTTAWDNIVFGPSAQGSGACCFGDGTCQVLTQNACADAAGTYGGDGVTCAAAACPQPGACCGMDGTCATTLPSDCTTAGGLFRGAASTCDAAFCAPFGFALDDINNDVGQLPGTAPEISGYGQKLTVIRGYMDLDDADMYKFQICDKNTFSASTVDGTGADTKLWLFDASGHGVVCDDDGPGTEQSTITGQFVPSNGVYYLAISGRDNSIGDVVDAVDGSNQLIFLDTNSSGQRYPQWVPNGPGAPNIVAGWTGHNNQTYAYTIQLTGACFLGCYANCDGSTSPPILNANDFQCFVNAFAGSLRPGMYPGYANCDGSSVAPILNTNDFQCFLNQFAIGCQ